MYTRAAVQYNERDTLGMQNVLLEKTLRLHERGREKVYAEICCITGYIKGEVNWTSSKNLSELEDVINKQADKGYRLHTISTTSGGSKGLGGGDRIQATMVFERIE